MQWTRLAVATHSPARAEPTLITRPIDELCFLLCFHLRVDRQKKFPLMRSHPRRADSLDQLGVLVYQPGLAEHIRSRIFQLKWS